MDLLHVEQQPLHPEHCFFTYVMYARLIKYMTDNITRTIMIVISIIKPSSKCYGFLNFYSPKMLNDQQKKDII